MPCDDTKYYVPHKRNRLKICDCYTGKCNIGELEEQNIRNDTTSHYTLILDTTSYIDIAIYSMDCTEDEYIEYYLNDTTSYYTYDTTSCCLPEFINHEHTVIIECNLCDNITVENYDITYDYDIISNLSNFYCSNCSELDTIVTFVVFRRNLNILQNYDPHKLNTKTTRNDYNWRIYQAHFKFYEI